MNKLIPCFFALAFIFFCSSSISGQDFYGSAVQEIRIEMPDKHWDVKLDSLKKVNAEARALGIAWVNGQKFDSVGVRYKGNSSYFRTKNDNSGVLR